MYTQERKQKFLNTFIERVNGKGQALQDGSCMYVKEGHPGCAIGCQPEFEPFKEIYKYNYSDTAYGLARNPNFCSAFGIEDEVDTRFLDTLQILHDGYDHWNKETGRIRRQVVEEFCTVHALTIPDSVYS